MRTTWTRSNPSLSVRVALLGLLGLLVLGLSVLAIGLRPAGAAVSLWWPAAGVSAVALLRARVDDRPAVLGVVAVASVTGSALSGLPLGLSLAYGAVGVVEAAVVVAVLEAGTREPALRRLHDLWRLLAAAAAGAVTAGVLAGAAVAAAGTGGFTASASAVVPSHASAFLLLVPFALRLPPSTDGDAGVRERLGQLAVLSGLLSLVFWESQVLPVTLLPALALVWAAVRCGLVTVLVQLAVTAAVAAGATLTGWGPFADTAASAVSDPRSAVVLVQGYLLFTTVIALVPALALQERQRALEQLSHLALHDPLTGLANRRLLLEELQAVQARQDRSGEPAVLLALDLDGFKQVNDVHGHLAGDRLLVAVADALRTAARAGDVLARTGGDEFVVLCPGLEAGSPDLAAVVQRLRTAVAATSDVLPGPAVGVSIGWAPVRAGAPMTGVLGVADTALYADKHLRRRGPGATTTRRSGPVRTERSDERD